MPQHKQIISLRHRITGTVYHEARDDVKQTMREKVGGAIMQQLEEGRPMSVYVEWQEYPPTKMDYALGTEYTEVAFEAICLLRNPDDAEVGDIVEHGPFADNCGDTFLACTGTLGDYKEFKFMALGGYQKPGGPERCWQRVK